MPVSYGFVNGAVHVLEGRLSAPERIERLLTAPGGMDALKILQEAGYGRGEEITSVSDYEGWLEARLTQVYSFVGKYTPEPPATDCFLLRIDYTNLKILYKAKRLEQDAQHMLREGGLLPLDTLSSAIVEQDYRRLTPPMQAALAALDLRVVADTINPRVIDTRLDKGYFEDIALRLPKVKSKAIKTYFDDLTDLTNLRTALRARAMGMTREELREQLVMGGKVPQGLIEVALEEPERALQAFVGRDFKYHLDEAVAAFGQTGALARYEQFLDNYLLALIKRGQWKMDSVEPLIGYLLGVEREAAAIRLCMVGQINDFPQEAVRERLGDLYV